MGFKCGIVGLPNVGKSTIFNAMTAAGAEASNYPFCTIEPNVGMVPLRDPRLYKLAELAGSKKTIETSVEFVDIAGLVKGASAGEGLGNQFLGHIRSVQVIAHVVRCFVDENVTHVHGKVDPAGDIATIETELMLADLDAVQKRLDRQAKLVRAGDKEAVAEVNALEEVKGLLESGKSPRSMDDEVKELVSELNLLSMKPVVYVANVDEDDLDGASEAARAVKEIADGEGEGFAVISGAIESDIAELDGDERDEFLESAGLVESGLDRLAHTAYAILGLLTFFTIGPKEAHAWTVRKGALAPEAAGVIHTDFEKGFIRAEAIGYDDYVECGTEAKCKEKGVLRVEGKDYVVADGDVMHFRFNV